MYKLCYVYIYINCVISSVLKTYNIYIYIYIYDIYIYIYIHACIDRLIDR